MKTKISTTILLTTIGMIMTPNIANAKTTQNLIMPSSVKAGGKYTLKLYAGTDNYGEKINICILQKTLKTWKPIKCQIIDNSQPQYSNTPPLQITLKAPLKTTKITYASQINSISYKTTGLINNIQELTVTDNKNNATPTNKVTPAKPTIIKKSKNLGPLVQTDYIKYNQ